MPPPLFTKYRTKKDRCYLYDHGTGSIIDVDETIYAIIDDYRLLSRRELLEKYRELGTDKVETALSDLAAIRKDGYLPDHYPEEPEKVEQVLFEQKLYRLDDFWTNTSTCLLLGVTERCNLCCDYCLYSGAFSNQRPHSNRSMSLDVAVKAIRDFLASETATDGDLYPVTFYGGEPLLELDLMRRIVEAANDMARQSGKEIRYTIATNGTLLDDRAVDFLVEHNVMTVVSFDGPRELHDRYRKFRNGTGSFETVMNNIRRFVERYPGYRNRGINMVVAPPFDLDATAALVDELYPDFPISRATVVNPGTDYRFVDGSDTTTRYGCYSKCGDCAKTTDLFRDFSETDRNALSALWNKVVEGYVREGLWGTKAKMPLGVLLFESQIGLWHRRNVTNRKPGGTFTVPCLPGFTKRFVDVEGNYRVCERVDNSDTFILGNVWKGLDPTRLERIMEQRRHFGDCGNCAASKTCDICYARIPNSDDMATGYDPYYDLQCQKTRLMSQRLGQVYTEIMEENETAFDGPGKDRTPRSESLGYGAVLPPLSPEAAKRLQCESLE